MILVRSPNYENISYSSEYLLDRLLINWNNISSNYGDKIYRPLRKWMFSLEIELKYGIK